MRNLIITRNKAFAGCAIKFKVYISDPEANELTIHNVSCRKLGTLKNGETAVFPIGETPARIFVIADKLSRNFCCEYCDVPEGNQDIHLRGKCLFDPNSGNPFHFDGNSTPPKAKGKGWIIGVVATVVCITAGLLLGQWIPRMIQDKKMTEPQVFTAEGMQITLSKAYQKTDVSEYGFTLGYASRETAIFVLKEEFTLSAGFEDLTLDEYAQLVLSNNQMLGGSPYQADGLTIYEYTEVSLEDGETYAYLIVFLKGPDAFWMFEFSTKEENAKAMRQTYLDFAQTIEFSGRAI